MGCFYNITSRKHIFLLFFRFSTPIYSFSFSSLSEFRGVSAISENGQVDKNKVMQLMLKNPNDLTNGEKELLSYVEKVLSKDEYKKIKETVFTYEEAEKYIKSDILGLNVGLKTYFPNEISNLPKQITKEFNDAAFADNRLNKRLTKIANSFYENPESSIPQACKSYAGTQATYRFFSNNRVKPEVILMSHREQTIERMRKYDTVLAIQDTTALDYKDHPATKGLGVYGNTEHDLGLLNHTTLAVTVDGIPLGILSRYVWTRNPKELGKRVTKRERSTSDKESQKWLDALDSSLKDVPKHINVVTVCDREADIYDFFHKAVSEERDLLVRVAQKRRVLENEKSLIQEIESSPVMGQLLISVPRDTGNKRAPREATLSMKYCPVTIKPPVNRKDSKSLPNLELYLVLAEEINPPKGIKPIYWLLLTTLPVENLEQAVEKIKWYKQRWKIERYHYTLKSGCNIEKLQLESTESLQNALAVYSIVAWKLLWLKFESEQNPEAACDIVLQQYEWQALYCVVNRVSIPPMQPPTLKEAVIMIAKLGGFLGRKSDGQPGVKVIWRGLMCLNNINLSSKIKKVFIDIKNPIKMFYYINTEKKQNKRMGFYAKFII
ncbi:IS4 family transposase [Clostridium kluyveri]|nr:IS4 family transposase [Clostridium kluyveri]UZQ50415.1 IS4 family transposase [Clostridium kluyveri]